MRILTATTLTNGTVDGDYDYCVPGELVMIFPACDNRKCGCDRGFGGLSSHRSTTTALVEDSEMAEADVRLALETSLRGGGWIQGGGAADDELVGVAFDDIVEIAGHFPAGTVLGRDDSEFYARNWSEIWPQLRHG